MKKKRFCTIVPHIENLELRKDTGQIPYHFMQLHNYESRLVSYFYTLKGGREAGPVLNPPTDQRTIDANYPYLSQEVPGLKMDFLPYKGRGKFYEKAIFGYVKTNARNIDVLNLFHFSSENIFYALLYKFKNPGGKVYLKLDIDIDFYESRKSFFNINGPFGYVKASLYHKLLLPLFFKNVALISAESNAGLSYFKKRFPGAANKLVLIPNGIDKQRARSLVSRIRPFEDKENIILTVGRIGNVQKNHDFLLKAIPHLALKDWKIYFVGPIDPGFYPVIDNFFSRYPNYKDHILFTGNITNPPDLYELYNRSKIFCLPSLWEGFPLAAVEAASFGNILLISENIHAFDTLTDNGRNGYKIELHDIEKFCYIIESLQNNHALQKKLIDQTYAYSEEQFSWSNIVAKIAYHLLKINSATG